MKQQRLFLSIIAGLLLPVTAILCQIGEGSGYPEIQRLLFPVVMGAFIAFSMSRSKKRVPLSHVIMVSILSIGFVIFMMVSRDTPAWAKWAIALAMAAFIGSNIAYRSVNNRYLAESVPFKI